MYYVYTLRIIHLNLPTSAQQWRPESNEDGQSQDLDYH